MPIHSSLNSLFHLLFIHLFFRKSIHSFVRSSVESSSPFIHWLSDWVSEWVRGCLNASFIHSFVPFFIFSLTCSLWFFPIWPGTKNRGRLRCPWLEEKGWGGGGEVGGLRRWGVMEGKISVTSPGTSKKWRNEAASSLSSCDFLPRPWFFAQDVRHWCN